MGLNSFHVIESNSIPSKWKDFNITTKKGKVFFKSGNRIIERVHNYKIYFNSIDFKDYFITFSGTFMSSSYPEAINIQAIKKTKNKDREIFYS